MSGCDHVLVFVCLFMSKRNRDKDCKTGRIRLSQIMLSHAAVFIYRDTHAHTVTHTNMRRNSEALPDCLDQSIGNQLAGM